VEVSDRHRPLETSLLLLALLPVAVGVVVYALDRGGAVYFLPAWLAGYSGPRIFGSLGDHLPTFVHPIALILITAAIMRPWPRTLATICIAWFAVECLFELGQITPLDGHIVTTLTAWFDGSVVTGFAAGYFVNGVFDPLDILSIGLGTATAYLCVLRLQKGE